jgi:hypothetical protein
MENLREEEICEALSNIYYYINNRMSVYIWDDITCEILMVILPYHKKDKVEKSFRFNYSAYNEMKFYFDADCNEYNIYFLK